MSAFSLSERSAGAGGPSGQAPAPAHGIIGLCRRVKGRRLETVFGSMLKVSLQEFALKVNQPDKTERNIRGAARSGARLRSGESGAKKIGLFVLILLLCLQLSSRAEAARPELKAFSQNVRQDKSVTPAREPGILKSDSLSPYVIEWY